MAFIEVFDCLVVDSQFRLKSVFNLYDFLFKAFLFFFMDCPFFVALAFKD